MNTEVLISVANQPSLILIAVKALLGFPGGTVVKNLSANAGGTREVGLIPGSGRSPGIGNGNLLQYSCLENPNDRGAAQAIVHGVAKSQAPLSTHIHKQVSLI